MASIRKRNDRWQVQVRRNGHAVSRTFKFKADAEVWARKTERSIDRLDLDVRVRDLAFIFFPDLLVRYRDTITPRKKGAETEQVRLTAMARQKEFQINLDRLTPSVVTKYRDRRTNEVTGETVRRELSLLQTIMQTARRDWDIPIRDNPFSEVQKPKPNPARTRRLEEGEEARLMRSGNASRNKLLKPLVQLAIETGMRRSELLGLRWDNIDFSARTAFLPDSKNGHAREIPLSLSAMKIIEKLPRNRDTVLPLTINAAKHGWRRLRDRAGVTGLRFHDLRHEAISRFFEKGLSIPEVALISGHRDPRMLFRYTALRASDVARKLA